MAQGTVKKSSVKAASSRRANPGAPKKGQRTIAPKRKTLVKQKGITKKYTAGLINKTERGLAEKVGHLEMLAGGKKSGRIGGEGKDGKKGAAVGSEGKDVRNMGNKKP